MRQEEKNTYGARSTQNALDSGNLERIGREL